MDGRVMQEGSIVLVIILPKAAHAKGSVVQSRIKKSVSATSQIGNLTASNGHLTSIAPPFALAPTFLTFPPQP